MKLLSLGAGAIGGYYGGKLAAAGVDVTFLVRPRRAEQLARDGLVIETTAERSTVLVKTVSADRVRPEYDAVLLTAKAYDLASAIDAIRPAMAAEARVLPLLNGMKHLDELDAAFGREKVLGGTSHVSTTLADDGVIKIFTPFAVITQGPREASQKPFSEALHTELSRGAFEARVSDDIIGVMWEKWVFLATLAGATCLMRGNIAEIVAAGGAAMTGAMFEECCAVAAASGRPISAAVASTSRGSLTNRDFRIAASMLRDIERGAPTEAAHIVGDLIARGAAHGVPTPNLALAYAHLQVYEARLDAARKPG